MTPKHTPAPWVISEDGWNIVSKTHYNASTDSYLSVPKNGSICVIPDTVISDEAEANAKLICAAPELLEACQYAYALLHQHPDDQFAILIDNLRKVINKATE